MAIVRFVRRAAERTARVNELSCSKEIAPRVRRYGLECTYLCLLGHQEETILKRGDGQRQTEIEPVSRRDNVFGRVAILNNERECGRRGWGK